MKKRKNLITKRILALFFIITLLSNHIMILSEVANTAIAMEVEWQSELTSDLNTLSNENNEQENTRRRIHTRRTR